jgi:anti-sigma regulatory factor (Ser/Thr protein kinase)
MFTSNHIPVADLSSVGEARRMGGRMAVELGFDETRAGELAIIITEAARNTVVHGRGGQIILSARKSEEHACIDVIALDKGPGITDISKAISDGYSTSGTPGTGLGAIRRLAADFEIFSTKQGTALFARLETKPESRESLKICAFAIPVAGERLCGDAVCCFQQPGKTVVLNVDGLGHGPEAAAAAQEAVRIFEVNSMRSPGEILIRVHEALKKTRGAAAAIAEISPLPGTLVYAGVGNISGVVLSKAVGRNMVSHNGTLGHIMPRVQEFKVDWPRDGILIMHSDGLQTRWDLSTYPGLLARKPALIGGILFRDFHRLRDDGSVAVVKGGG